LISRKAGKKRKKISLKNKANSLDFLLTLGDKGSFKRERKKGKMKRS